jgi:all-trans-retinol 13,14-reductase
MAGSYKQNPQLHEPYDTIFIGSGMGSLSAAALLSKEGQRVLVLEQHYTPGGYTHVFKRKGFEWDVGIHYIGEMQRRNSAMYKLFHYITDGALQWADMGEVYDRIFLGSRSFDLVRGVENFKTELSARFPGEEEALAKYVELVFKANRKGGPFYMAKALPPVLSRILGGLMSRPFLKYADRTTYEVLRELTENEDLIRVLCGQYGDYGLPPKKSSFAMHATVVRHYFDGGSFPVGGSSRIVKTIEPLIERSGGTILVNAPVKQVLVENDRAAGVLMEDGKSIHAKQVVSGTGIVNTLKHLLPSEVVLQHGMRETLNKVTPSACHACLYLGLEGTPEELGLPKTNYWIYPEEGDHDLCVERYLENPEEEFPVVYISFPAAKDPDFQNRYPGKSTIDIITLVPWNLFEKWEGTAWMKRGEEYEALKKRLANRLTGKLLEHFPNLEDKIRHQELSTPLSTQFFTRYEKGEIYGIDHSPSRFRQKNLQPRTPLKGFYLTGQDIVTAGIGGALFSGLLTASALSGKNLMKKVMND